MTMLSESTENYLTAILRLEDKKGAAATSTLAQHLEVAPASVTGMLKKLALHGLVEHRRYRGTQLTSQGRDAALAVIRRHRLVETFLVRVLGLEPKRVHAEAHRWEHVLSDDVVERLDAWLGHPERDPHGTPIPAPVRRRPVETRLTALAAGEQGVVLTAGGNDDRHAAYIRKLGLVPGAMVRAIKRRPFGGPLSLDVAGRRSIVGPEVTDFVTIREEGIEG